MHTSQEVLDGAAAFARQMQLRQAAKEAFSFVDASQRLRASMLRKTTPTRGPFLAGDLVCFYRKGRSSHGRWYGPARVLGQEGRSTLWIIHGGVSMTVGIESLRHATGNEVLAKHALELRPSRRHRREVLDPDKDEMNYPFADDLIGAPGIDNAEDVEQIPFFDLGTQAPEEPAEQPAEPETPVLPQEPAQSALMDGRDLHVDVPLPEELDNDHDAMEDIPVPPGLTLGSDQATEIYSSTDEPELEAVPPTRVDTPLGNRASTPLNQALHHSLDAVDGIPLRASRRERSPPPRDPRYEPAALPDGPEARAFVGFLARITTKKSATARAKELNYNKSDDARQSKMLEARSREWAN